MDTLLWLKALILGILEGATEFLPISSTGHLIIAADLLHYTGEQAKVFEIVIQLGAIVAVVYNYRAKVGNVVGGLGSDPVAQRFAVNLLIAFLPASMLGVALHGFIKSHLFNPFTVAAALMAGGFVILAIEHFKPAPRIHSVDEMRWPDALKVGLAQSFALFPGVSRAGSTIMGGLVVGLSRPAATEFSFFLAIPTMFAATTYDLYKNLDILHTEDFVLFAIGFAAAFVSALIVVRSLLAYVGRHDFKIFAYYRIVFGLVVLWYFWP
ncbi:MAG: undecaprenyl-diphosphate phosphatase [Pseudomonadota bacterium]